MGDIPFRTTPSQADYLIEIVGEMLTKRVNPTLVALASSIAASDQGVYDLMFMWMSEQTQETINDLHKSILDWCCGYWMMEREEVQTKFGL